MKLTKTNAPVKKKKPFPYKKCVRQARMEYRDTGMSREVKLSDRAGKVMTTMEPVKERVFVPAEYEEGTEERDVWVVETTFEGKTEEHDFASEEAALNFVRES